MHVIEIERLCKRYRQRQVLFDFSLQVAAGTRLGFLGPNGAGKTTTLRILMGLLRASSGCARLLGFDCWREGPRLRGSVGYLPGEVRFYDTLTGRQTLDFFARVRRCDAGGEIARLQRVFDLDLDRRVRKYSSGMKQKLGLIQALMHRPALLILDEPTTNLDPLVRQALYDELRRVSGEGRTVLFSSHTLGEVEALCDDVAVLRDGRLVEHQSVEVLRRRALRRVEIVFQEPPPPASFPAALRVTLRNGPRVHGAWSGDVAPLLDFLSGQALRDLVIAPPDLEDLFLGYYQTPARVEAS